MMDLFLMNMQDWCGVDYCDVVISCLDSHSDGTHSLRASIGDAMLHFSKSDDLR